MGLSVVFPGFSLASSRAEEVERGEQWESGVYACGSEEEQRVIVVTSAESALKGSRKGGTSRTEAGGPPLGGKTVSSTGSGDLGFYPYPTPRPYPQLRLPAGHNGTWC